MNKIEAAILRVKTNIEVTERIIIQYETELECYERILEGLENIKSNTTIPHEERN
jgi:succinate dehydrogenase/fumarate reductase-like Fe-S protein